MADNDELDDFDEQEEEGSGDAAEESHASGDGDVAESLMSRLGENGRSALKPVASAAAVAAATYVARNGPQLLKELGGDKAREKLGQTHEQGGVTGFAAGAAKRALSGSGGNVVERLKKGGEDEARKQAADSGGALGALGKAAAKLSGSSEGGAGWGKGRRLPIMQSIDVAAPADTVYNQWTQFEENNAFMHRVEGVEQEDDATVVWHENIWGRRRDWKAKITASLLPPDHPLFLLLASPRRLRYRMGDGLWVRLVDVGAALSGRQYGGEGSIVFDVKDDFCAWNEGRWKLDGGVVARTDERADLSLPVQSLASAFLGGISFAALSRAGRAQELTAEHEPRFAVHYQKQNHVRPAPALGRPAPHAPEQ